MKPHTRNLSLPSGLTVLLLAVTLCPSFSSDVLSTTSAPTPPEPPSIPETGSYNVTNNGTACLLASMGLQLNITYTSRSQGKAVQVIINLQPNMTNATGSCEPDTATIKLINENTNLTFLFHSNSSTNKYYLGGLSLSIALPDMTQPLVVSNTSLDYLQGTLGYSYMCHQELILPVGEKFSLNTFHLRVQPFNVSGQEFGAAEECQLDKDDMLIPIAVGAALAGLVLVVLLAYLIGRKRSHAGYQTI
ncbi:lysosome-associated membrane glycoprotein 1b [Clarias gariepinus]|uniref:lysosome-associated membrane glycoprotein 1b n=1 Tax=Clarias gariepinus TaxID=13013 RepID=UPI00234C1350|nr:lysosome-associated membrane glycoprotein 1b [Clarias gariepinus]